MADAPHLRPFVLPVDVRAAERRGTVDLYFPEAAEPRPAIVFAHGFVLPDARPTPRDWPVYRGYGSLAASRGVVGAVVDHRLHSPASCPQAADDLAAAVRLARADPRVDPERVAIWGFSGAGLLLADWLREPPSWLRCVAASYPIFGGPAETVAGALPIVLTRVGHEHPRIAATVEAFVSAARARGAQLDIVDVPHGQHGFDVLDHTDESRVAVERALGAVLTALTGAGPESASPAG
jgi:acetyl esterase/lipase